MKMPSYATKGKGRYVGRRRFRYRHSTKKLRAAGRAAKRARYRRSARSQAKQINTIGRSVVRVQKQLAKDTTAFSTWQTIVENHQLDADAGGTTAVNKGIFVLPLTSGPASVANGAQSSLQQGGTIKDMTWMQVQPHIRDTESTTTNKHGPSWIKLYTQSIRMCFYQNNMNRGARFDLYVVRLARNDETQSDNTMLSRLTSIDGAAFTGCPNAGTRFNENEDFYACDGWRNPTGSDAGGTDPLGYELVRMNPQRYVVEHHRSFALGRTVGPTGGGQVVTASTAGTLTQHARDFYECSFKVNYGGAKLMATDDDTSTSNEPITLSDIKYTDIDPKLKRWIVIFPSRQCTSASTMGVPRFSYVSNVTCKVPT